MNADKKSTARTNASVRFTSLGALREAHNELMKQYLATDEAGMDVNTVRSFIEKGKATGALLASEDERLSCQSILDYWMTFLFRVAREAPDVTLHNFDQHLAPDLPDDACPYVGLSPFQTDDSRLYFGQQRLIKQMIDHLQTKRLLVVTGPSGCGKSSVVLAGLIPDLQAGALPGSSAWQYLPPLLPGPHPLDHLKRAQAKISSERTAVIIVDQFEEIFTLCSDQATRQQFASAVIDMASSKDHDHRVVLTLRSDFEFPLAKLGALQSQLSESQIRVTPLSAAELTEAVERPAELAGLRFEAGIVDALVQSILGEPAGLPLLQFTLMKLWENRKKNLVTWEMYQRLGGSRQALERSANEFFEALLPQDQTRAKYIFLRMVTPGEGLEVTSNRIQRKTLYRTEGDRQILDPVLKKLVHARLIRLTKGDEADHDQLEVAHEALVRNWDRFIDWIEAERIMMRGRIRLTSAAEQWDRSGRSRDYLLRGVQLEVALQCDDLNALETEYVTASKNDLEEERKRWQELVDRAEQQTRIAKARELAASSQMTRCSHRSLLLAVEALYQTRRVGERVVASAEEALRIALAKAVGRGLGKYHHGAVTQLQFIRGSSWLITTGADKTIRFWDLNDPNPGKASIALRGHEGSIGTLAVTPDGCGLFTGSADHTVRFWDLRDLPHRPASHIFSSFRFEIRDIKVSPNGQWLIVATADKMISLWNLHDPALPHIELYGHSWGIRMTTFSSDSHWMLSASDDQTARLWNLEDVSGDSILLGGFQDAVWGVYFTPDNRWLIAGSLDGTLRLWARARPGDEPIVLKASRGNITAMTISPDSRWLVVGDSEHAVRMWDLDDLNAEPKMLTGHEDWIVGLTVSGDNRWLISYSGDKTVRLWELGNLSMPPVIVRGHEGCVRDVQVSDDNRLMASCSDDGTVQLVSLKEPWISPSPHVFCASRAPLTIGTDSHQLAAAYHENAILCADLNASAENPRRFECNGRFVRDIAISPDGKYLAAGTEDPTLFLWDLTSTDSPRRGLIGHAWGIQTIKWSADSQWLVTGSDDWSVRIWKLSNPNAAPWYLKCNEGIVRISISRDQRWLTAGDWAGSVYVWKLADLDAPPMILQNWHNNPISILRISPDSRWLVAAARDERQLGVWELGNLSKPPHMIPGQGKRIMAAEFTPDAQRLVTVYSEDPLVRLWNMADLAAEPQILRGHEWGLRATAISSDNRWMATASDDRSVQLWALDALREDPVVFRFDQETVSQLAISDDSHWLVTASMNGPIRVWSLHLDELIHLAQHAAGRNLMLGEWQQYFGNQIYSKTCLQFPVPREVIEHELERVHLMARNHDGDALKGYGRVVEWAVETDDPVINDQIARLGCLDNFAEVVLPAGERAVALDPDNGDYRVVCGIARALIHDTQEAMRAFDQLSDNMNVFRFKQNLPHKADWIAQLKQGKNPFDHAFLQVFLT